MATMTNPKMQSILNELFKVYHDANDPYMDGFNQWENKKVLIDVKYTLDKMLRTASNFGPIEEEYVKQKEQEQLIGILKK
jgi:hypothetical protein